MVNVDRTEPADIVDRLLWQDAQTMLGRHVKPDPDGDCVWCGWRWPCAPRRLAERAAIASRRPWREAWTLRHDLNSIRAMPGVRTGLEDSEGAREVGPAGGNRRVRHAGVNRGYFTGAPPSNDQPTQHRPVPTTDLKDIARELDRPRQAPSSGSG